MKLKTKLLALCASAMMALAAPVAAEWKPSGPLTISQQRRHYQRNDAIADGPDQNLIGHALRKKPVRREGGPPTGEEKVADGWIQRGQHQAGPPASAGLGHRSNTRPGQGPEGRGLHQQFETAQQNQYAADEGNQGSEFFPVPDLIAGIEQLTGSW